MLSAAFLARRHVAASAKSTCIFWRRYGFIRSVPTLASRVTGQLRARWTQTSLPHRWQRLRSALERHGDPIITAANIFQLSGFACSDALNLQSIMILGNGGMALFFITRIPTMKVPFAWAFLKVCVNIYMVFKLTSERQPVKLTEEQFDVYEEHFMPYGITARQFQKFWNHGENLSLPKGAKIITEGQPTRDLSLVLAGHAYRTQNGEHMPGLDTFPGARDNPDGDAGAWVADIFVMQMIDKVSASDSVSRELYRRKVEHAFDGRSKELHTINSGQVSTPVKPGPLLELQSSRHGTEESSVEAGEGTVSTTEQFEVVLNQNICRWTVTAGEDCVIRTWRLKPLLDLCASNTEISSVLRKTLSQSVIKKVLAMEQGRLQKRAAREGSVSTATATA